MIPNPRAPGGARIELGKDDLICPKCHRGWEVRVELWRFYGIAEKLPSPPEDR